jgi:hypothetical protein
VPGTGEKYGALAPAGGSPVGQAQLVQPAPVEPTIKARPHMAGLLALELQTVKTLIAQALALILVPGSCFVIEHT